MNDTHIIAGDPARAERRPFSIVGHEAEAVTHRVWGNVDTVMLIFAGAAAEFAVNRAVDWLFWTNVLPRAPIRRFFQTVRYAQAVLLGDPPTVAKQMAAINRAHRGVERSRGAVIPPWAYRDVLFMLINYGERAHTVVFGPMTRRDRVAYWEVMRELGEELEVEDLPVGYPAYQAARQQHLEQNTAHTAWTDQLYTAYRKDLGPFRMSLLRDLQASLIPAHVAGLLGLRRRAYMDRLLRLYRYTPRRIAPHLGPLLVPRPYYAQATTLAHLPTTATNPHPPRPPAENACPWSG